VTPLPVFVTESAATAITEASEWWFWNRPSAPNALADDLETVLALVSVQPRLGARVRNVGLSGVRRVHLARVHYHLYYRVASSGTELEVLAFWHTSRGTGPLIEPSR
jgi:plasmid stabilization system protein ParE